MNRAGALLSLKMRLSEIYFVENQLLGALAMNAKVAQDDELVEAFQAHHSETVRHIQKVEALFKELGEVPGLFPSQAITGLLDDGKWIIVRMKGDPLLDFALIDAAQKAENYEISCYQSILALARYLDIAEVVRVTKVILEEEKDAKRKVRNILLRLLGLETEDGSIKAASTDAAKEDVAGNGTGSRVKDGQENK